jgi:flavin-dependent dehydrogenase
VDAIIIIGAGPAGCSASRLLAAWGHRVLVVERPPREHALAESIPPSAQKILATIGALPAVEDAGFQPWLGNTVWWGHAAPRVEAFPPGAAGYQVVRSDFDRILRDLARQSGAELRTGLVRQVTLPGLDQAAGPAYEESLAPSVTIERDGAQTRIGAPFVLDCSGRAGVVARLGLRQGYGGPAPTRTVALAGVWRASEGWGGVGDGHTLVASYGDGWAWSIATRPGVRYFTVMVDPARTSLARGGPPLDVYRAELGKVAAFGPLLARATLTEGPWGADASAYAAERYAGPGFLLVGDAGSFIDPLSSFGVKKALASGWLAAITVHTALTRPSMAGDALEFFERRERSVYASATARSARFAVDAAAAAATPFWQARSASADDADPDDDPDPSALARDADVLAAFADLRERPSVRLSAGADLRFGPKAAIRGREIVFDEHLFGPAWPGGIRYLRNVDLVALARLAPGHTDVGMLCEAMSRESPQASLPDVLGALAVLVARGALRHG